MKFLGPNQNLWLMSSKPPRMKEINSLRREHLLCSNFKILNFFWILPKMMGSGTPLLTLMGAMKTMLLCKAWAFEIPGVLFRFLNDGFQTSLTITSLWEERLLTYYALMTTFYWISLKIMGSRTPLFKLNGPGMVSRTPLL